MYKHDYVLYITSDLDCDVAYIAWSLLWPSVAQGAKKRTLADPCQGRDDRMSTSFT